jgi:hypothetical protein
MSATELKLYDVLKTKLGEKEATLFFEFIEAKTDEEYEQKKDILATKEDIGFLRKEIAESKTDMIKWFLAFFITISLMIVGLY